MRAYGPWIGRFTQMDPLGDGYAYAGNNPATHGDPTGLFLDTALDRTFITHDLHNLEPASKSLPTTRRFLLIGQQEPGLIRSVPARARGSRILRNQTLAPTP